MKQQPYNTPSSDGQVSGPAFSDISTTESTYRTASTRCFTTTEIVRLLSPETTTLPLSTSPPAPADETSSSSSPTSTVAAVSPHPPSPASGSLFLYNRRVTKSFKRDGHSWAKKPVGGKRCAGKNLFKVAENCVKLRLPDGRYRVAGWYARSDGMGTTADSSGSGSGSGSTTFRRRAYYLINPDDLKRDGDLVLVHYLDDTVEAEGDRGGRAAATVGGRPNTNTQSRAQEPSGGGGGEKMTNSSGVGTTSCVDAPREKRACDVSMLPQCSNKTTDRQRPRREPSAAYWVNGAPGLDDEDTAKEWEHIPKDEKARAIADIYGWEEGQLRGAAALLGLGAESAAALLGLGAGASSGAVAAVGAGAGAGFRLGSFGCVGGAGGNDNQFATQLFREIQTSQLELLDREITALPPSVRGDYDDAMRRCPQVVFALKVQFLRCENNCTKAAARRMVNYWKQRVILHGADAALLWPSLNGVLAGDCDDPVFRHARLLPGTDASGRGMIFVDTTIRGSPATEARSLWYMAHAALEIDRVRDNGVIFIFFNTVDSLEKFDYDDIDAKHHLILDSFPVNVRAFHICQFNGRTWFVSVVYAALRFMVGRFMRCRTVFHEAASKELVLLQLAEYGISRNQLPPQIGGSYTDDNFEEWLTIRRESGR